MGVPVRFKVFWVDDARTGYGFATDTTGWDLALGPLVVGGLTGLDAKLIDMNFDGYADLWVSASVNQRATGSDVWLYDPPDALGTRHRDPDLGVRVLLSASDYRYHSGLSSLPNLSIDTTAQRLLAGIGNCGGAGACFYSEVYRWEGGDFVIEQRRSQDVSGREFEYQVWNRQGDQLVRTLLQRDSVHTRDVYDLEERYRPDYDSVW
ncbi:MAG: hypothetical protein Rubg2KO_06820 [Rubricoccaceae bacterium]